MEKRMYQFSYRFFAALLPLIMLSACETASTQHIQRETSPGITFVVPPGAERQAAMTALLQHPEQSDNGEIQVVRQYVSASGHNCMLMGLDKEAAASQWVACQNAANGWVVKPALLNADAVFGVVR